jgi:hypothetical protein
VFSRVDDVIRSLQAPLGCATVSYNVLRAANYNLLRIERNLRDFRASSLRRWHDSNVCYIDKARTKRDKQPEST